MAARDSHAKLSQIGIMKPQPERARKVTGLGRYDLQIRLRHSSIRNRAPANRRQNLLDIFVVQAQNGRAVERNFVDELSESRAYLNNRRIVVQMLTVDVGDDGQNGREFEERSVTLVRFHHQEIAVAQARVGPPHGAHPSAHDYSRVQAGMAQNGRRHRRRGGFPVTAGDGDAEFQPHQFGKQLAPRNHRDIAPPRFGNLRVLFVHGGSDYHSLSAIHVGGRMAFIDTGP